MNLSITSPMYRILNRPLFFMFFVTTFVATAQTSPVQVTPQMIKKEMAGSVIKKDLKLLSELSIDKTTSQNVEKISKETIIQAKKELPEKLQKGLTSAIKKMISAKKTYDTAQKNKDKKAMTSAKDEFKKAKKKLKKVPKERDKFIKQYGDIIEQAFKNILRKESEIEAYKNALHKALSDFDKNQTEANQKELGSALFDYELSLVTKYLSNKMNNEEGREKLGNNLKYKEISLGQYIHQQLENKIDRTSKYHTNLSCVRNH